MGESLFELEQILRSSKYKLTRGEEDILRTCKAKAVRDFTVGAFVASGAVWTATRRLGYGYRISLSSGAAVFSGMWRFDRSLNSCLDHILAMEGSRMQRELANLILTKHRDDPWRMQLVKKHFYSENVFDDSTLDRPISRWRLRNFFGENVTQSQRTHDDDTYGDSTDLEPKQITEPRQFPMSPGVEVIADPLECVFGYSGISEEIHHLDTTGVSPNRRNRSHKRTHRRHRTRHAEASSNDTSFQHSQAQVE